MLVALIGGTSPQDVVWGSIERRGVESEGGQVAVVVKSIEAAGTTFASALQSLISNDGSLILIEAQTLSAAYCPALKAIKEVSPNFGFYLELVKVDEQKPEMPSIYANGNLNVNHLFEDRSEDITVTNLVNNIEYGAGCRLDNSQYQAMKHMLSSRIAVVQGPPGTGKTYIGVHLTKILLDLDPSLASPVLVMTYKNHALDEFSESILSSELLKTPGNFIRFGNQSKNEKMNRYALKNHVKRPELAEFKLKNEIKRLSVKVKDAFPNFRSVLKEPLEIDTMLKFFDSFQLASMIEATLKEDDWPERLKAYKSIEAIGQAIFEHLGTRKCYPAIDFLMNKLMEALEDWLPSDKFTDAFMLSCGQISAGRRMKTATHDRTSFSNYDDQEATFESEKLFEEIFEASGLGNEVEGNFVIRESDLTGPMIDPYGSQSPECFRNFDLVTEMLARKEDTKKIRALKNLWKLSELARLHLVQYIVWKQREFVRNEMNLLVDQLHEKVEERNRMKLQRELEAVGKCKVVAMTVTGAAMRVDLLNAVKPQVIIVEEAAEISEAHLIPLLGNHVEHLVLIGDHKQLRPSVTCFDLVEKCNFDVSMMERLINNNAQFATLATQNRMSPDISKYLRDIYPQLEDHERVKMNPPVTGLAHNCFFWDHDNLETGGRSYYNYAEAEAVVELVSYLVDGIGYLPEKITLLSGHQGQTGELRKLMRKNTRLALGRPIDVQTIDMFQGDENDIVIVSLVRNNRHATSGFIGVLNRRCVAQSRARSGVIFLGNAATLERRKRSAEVWTPFLNALKEDGHFGKSLILSCPKHPDITKGVSVGESFRLSKFCNEVCGRMMSCGMHTCPELCSNSHFDHSRCSEQVDFTHLCGIHTGKKFCYENAQELKCTTMVDHEHACGHTGQKKCYMNTRDVKCQAQVEFIHICGIHQGAKKCYQEPHHVKCNAPCAYKYHQTEPNQEQRDDVEHDEDRDGVHSCDKQCGDEHTHNHCPQLVKVFCDENLHSVDRKCFEKNYLYKCCELIQFTHIACGHTGVKLCHQDPLDIICAIKVDHTCPKCGQHGSKKCHENIFQVQCFARVQFNLSCGRHESYGYCYEDAITKECHNTCNEKLYPCGDPCKDQCMSQHSHFDQKCQVIKTVLHHCGTTLTKKCYEKGSDLFCIADCPDMLKCGHACPENCGPAHNHDDVLCGVMVRDTCPL